MGILHGLWVGFICSKAQVRTLNTCADKSSKGKRAYTHQINLNAIIVSIIPISTQYNPYIPPSILIIAVAVFFFISFIP